MDSPLLQTSPHLQRLRTSSNLSVHSAVDSRGAIQKRYSDRARSTSHSSHAHRLQHLTLDQVNQFTSQPATSASFGLQWFTPQHSPELQSIYPVSSSFEPSPTWTAPTPPRSDSGVPTVCLDLNEEPVSSGDCMPQTSHFDPPVTSAEMSSLGFLLPSQYGSGLYESEPSSYTMDPSHIPSMRVSQPNTTTSSAATYPPAISSSPALYQSKGAPSSANARRHTDLPSSGVDASYNSSYRRISNPYDGGSNSDFSVVSAQTIPSISGLTQGSLPSPALGSNPSGSGLQQYNTSASRSPSLYDPGSYNQQQQAYTTSAPSSNQQLYTSSQSMSYPPPFVGSSVNEVLAKPLGSDASVRVLNQRPKPQCWEHGCNGRQFSTFSNLLRHQREKSGTASKSYCPKCGAEFTRTTARNGHLAHDKCTKQRAASDDQ